MKKDPNKRIWGLPPKRVQETPSIFDVLPADPVKEPPKKPVETPKTEPAPIAPPPTPEKPVKQAKIAEKPVSKEDLSSDYVIPKKKKRIDNDDKYEVVCIQCHKRHWYYERTRRETDKASICPKCKKEGYTMED
jgi:hypothetical protein